MIIYLSGVQGVGKTTIGKLLAEKLGFSFFDSSYLYNQYAKEKFNIYGKTNMFLGMSEEIRKDIWENAVLYYCSEDYTYVLSGHGFLTQEEMSNIGHYILVEADYKKVCSNKKNDYYRQLSDNPRPMLSLKEFLTEQNAYRARYKEFALCMQNIPTLVVNNISLSSAVEECLNFIS